MNRSIIFTVTACIFICCVSKKVQVPKLINTNKLTSRSIKFWNPVKGKKSIFLAGGWLFRQNNTFSYFEKDNSGAIKIIKRFDDIKVGENGIVPWLITGDTLEIVGVKYKILQLTIDSLQVRFLNKSTYSNNIDTMFFAACKNCRYR